MPPEQVLGDLNGHLPAGFGRHSSQENVLGIQQQHLFVMRQQAHLATLVVHSVVDESNPNDSIESGPGIGPSVSTSVLK